MLEKASIILVRPQLDVNVGSVARIMMNFGFSDLRIVSPIADCDSEEACAVARKAASIVRNAVVFDKFVDSIADLDYLYCTSCRSRELDKDFILPGELQLCDGKIGFVFGPENSGLSNEELCYSNKVLTIDTSEDFRSMNLSQAVCIICHEVFSRLKSKSFSYTKEKYPFTKGQASFLVDFLESELDMVGFFKEKNKKPRMMRNISNIFHKMEISEQEMQTLIGIFKHLVRGKNRLR